MDYLLIFLDRINRIIQDYFFLDHFPDESDPTQSASGGTSISLLNNLYLFIFVHCPLINLKPESMVILAGERPKKKIQLIL